MEHLVDDVTATLDVQGFAGDQPCGVMRQERCREAHIVDANKAARGKFDGSE